MPPQQRQRLLDVLDDGFDFGTHGERFSCSAGETQQGRHCEERSDEAIQNLRRKTGLLRCARNDDQYNPPVDGRTAPAAESGETPLSGTPLALSAPSTE
jgi:hypothetical protein